MPRRRVCLSDRIGEPDRLLNPLMRTTDGFGPASWDEALDYTARRLREIKHEPDEVAV